MRHSSGLRNKYRTGQSSNYNGRNAARTADNYGSWTNGIQTRSERINGTVVVYNHHTGEWR